jgi:hypothetical protein
VTLAQVHAALAYYHLNRGEIDDDLTVEDAEDAEVKSPTASTVTTYRGAEATLGLC